MATLPRTRTCPGAKPERPPRLRFVGATLLLLGLLTTVDATATSIREMRIGLLNHDTDGLWSGLKREHGPDVNAEVIFDTPVDVFGIVLRPAAGGTINTRGDTSKVYAYARWEQEWGDAFLALGLGAAWHDGQTGFTSPDRKSLGSRVLFHVPAEIGYAFTPRYAASIYFDHMSNAGLADRNEGMDSLGVRLGIRF